MSKRDGTLVVANKRVLTKSYLLDFGTTSKASVQLNIPFSVGAMKFYYPVGTIQMDLLEVAGANTGVQEIFSITSDIVSDTDEPIAFYVAKPITYNEVCDKHPRTFYFEDPKRINGAYNFYQCSSTNNFAFNGTDQSLTYNKVYLTIQFYEY